MKIKNKRDVKIPKLLQKPDLKDFKFPAKTELVHVGVFLGQVRRHLYEKHGSIFSQNRVGRMLGLQNGQYVSNFERGLHMPSARTVAILSDFYGIPRKVIYDIFMKQYEHNLKDIFL